MSGGVPSGSSVMKLFGMRNTCSRSVVLSVRLTLPRSSKMPSSAEVWLLPSGSSVLPPKLSSTDSFIATPGMPGLPMRPSMMIRPAASPFRPSTGTLTRALTKISKRSGVMRRKKPPNSSTTLSASGLEEPFSLILSEPRISIENDDFGRLKVWNSARRSALLSEESNSTK
jgi:hypothetical protein